MTIEQEKQLDSSIEHIKTQFSCKCKMCAFYNNMNK